MDILEFKRRLLDTGLFKKATNGWYSTKTCPYCGDMKNHMYVYIDPGSENPIGYNCFKCHSKGLMKQDFLDYYGIQMKVPYVKGRNRLQQNSPTEMIGDLIDPEKHAGTIMMCQEYFERRLGVVPSISDLKAFQLIGDPESFVRSYLGGESWGLKDRLWFLMSNGGMAGRSIDDNVSLRWRKRTRNDVKGGLYSIKSPIATDKPIIVCICEGVLDAIGLYYHCDIPNAAYIACMGSDYVNGVKYAIDMGVFGDSVTVHIYKDSDVNFVTIPKMYSQLFKSVSVYRNSMAKDFGVKQDMIELEKTQTIQGGYE